MKISLLSLVFAVYLSLNLNSGAVLELSDGSQWIIKPEDTSITSYWLTPSEIEIKKTSQDPTYLYTLTNYDTKQSVMAKKN